MTDEGKDSQKAMKEGVALLTKQIQEIQAKNEEIIHKRHDQEISAEVFLFLVIFLQIGLFFCQRQYPKRFQEITFSFLMLYPITLIYHSSHLTVVSYGFIAIWVLWSARTYYLMYLSLGPPFKKAGTKWKLAKTTPNKVYTWFLRTHYVCYYAANASLYLFFFIPGPALLVAFVSLYFGVLGRDCAEICADRINSTIGYSNEEFPPTNVCALCDVELKPTLKVMLGEANEAEVEKIKTLTLACGHEFHLQCILGWSLVGKKDICPFCSEKVDLRSILPERAWDSKRLSIWWIRLLQLMRYLLVWNPIVTYASIYFLKIFHFEPPVDAHGEPIY